jgi:hypothetical protein
MAFTPNVLLHLHGMLYRYMPNPGGRWRRARRAGMKGGTVRNL